jgi:hypothetical protein
MSFSSVAAGARSVASFHGAFVVEPADGSGVYSKVDRF